MPPHFRVFHRGRDRMPSRTLPLDHVRRRSVGFLEREGRSWACFLVTFRDEDLRWHGYFSFRPRDGEARQDEIRTADIFLEPSEGEIDRKARALGRPLLRRLLDSALHTRRRGQDDSPRLRNWFRQMLRENSREIAEDWPAPPSELLDEDGASPEPESEEELSRLRSLYESYRLDQVAHFIALVHPGDFRDAVDRILDGRSFDFGAKDRLQFAMMVVEQIEELLPLPPFEVWVEDYLARPEQYRLYAHTLHRQGRLP